MSIKNSHNILGLLVGIYLLFSVFYLLFLFLSPITFLPTLLLFLFAITSLFLFSINFNKQDKYNFYRNFLLLITIIYLMELPYFIFKLNPIWRARLVITYVSPDYIIWFSFAVIILTMPYAIKNSLPPQRKVLSKIFHPSVRDEDKVALGISLFFFVIGLGLFLISFTPTFGSITGGLQRITGGLQLILYISFTFLLVKTYLHDGLLYAIILTAGFVSTLIYFEFSYLYNISFVETLWIVPFVLAGLFYIFSYLFSRGSKKKHTPIKAIQ